MEKWRMGGISLWGQEQQKRREREKLTGGGQSSPFRKGNPANVHLLLLVPAPEDESCRDRKGRPVQMPEHQQGPCLVLTPITTI